MHPALLRSSVESRSVIQRCRLMAWAVAASKSQSGEISLMRDLWTEEDITMLAAEEPDTFDRKSGGIMQKSPDDLYDALAKAASAFSNSGGGTLILGVADDGTIDGVDATRGKTSMKDWLEQKLPGLVTYPLSLFRVHTVQRSKVSAIPKDKVVIVIEFGDSPLAPHQNARDKKYYHRAAGRSEPAGHFYIELLRQRLTSPSLAANITGVAVHSANSHQGRTFLETSVRFLVRNEGRVAAYKWELAVRNIENPYLFVGGEQTIFVHRSNFPLKSSRGSYISVDDTILPGCATQKDVDVGFWLPTGASADWAVDDLMRSTVFKVQIATETSPGEHKSFSLADAVDGSNVRSFISV